MKSDLIIIQDKPTQFDSPFYAYLVNKGVMDINVYYTETYRYYNQSIDPEIGRSPQWDHLATIKYPRRDIPAIALRSLFKLADEIASQRPHLVILCGYFPLLHAKLALLLKRSGIRIGLRSDNTIFHSVFKGPKGILKRLFLPSWLRYYDTWHPVGTLARRYLEQMTHRKRPTHFFPYSVDNEWFCREAAKYRRNRDAIRRQIGLWAKDFVILGILKWNDREDPLTLLEAFSVLLTDHSNVRLLMVGDGPLRSTVYGRATRLGGNVFFPGYVPYSELPKYYAVSDVFVHPAVNEPWGVSVNEAMACGLAVIAAHGVGAAADLISDGETGFVFPNRNAHSLAQQLSYLINNAQLTHKMGRAATIRMLQWNYERTCREMLLALGAI